MPPHRYSEKARRTAQSILQTMLTLASHSLSFVAALAWNNAIQLAFAQILGTSRQLTALFTYAIAATVLAVVVVGVLSWLAAKLGGAPAIDRLVD